jgi:hypothetical protein
LCLGSTCSSVRADVWRSNTKRTPRAVGSRSRMSARDRARPLLRTPLFGRILYNVFRSTFTTRDTVPRHSCTVWNVLRRFVKLSPQRDAVPTLRLYDGRSMMTCAKSAPNRAAVWLPSSSSFPATETHLVFFASCRKLEVQLRWTRARLMM